jgi:hypothetical protein
MKLALIGLLLFYIGCQDYNSNTFDKDRYGEIELTGGPKFEAAYPVLQTHCMSCHRHAQWSEYTNKQDWVDNENLVVAGSPDSSQLITRIINHGSANSDMPQGGNALPTADYDALVDWVTNF